MNFVKSLGLGVGLALLAAGVSFGGEKLTPEQQEIKQFIAKMYSYDPASFEYGEFSKKDGSPFLLNRVPKNGKKYDPPRHCALLRDFFDEELIKKDSRPGFVQCDAGSRFYLYDEEMSSDTRVEDIKGPEIRMPIVRGDKAMVFVFVGKKSKPNEHPSQRALEGYLLAKTDKGWQIRLTWSEIEETIREVKYSPDNRSSKLDACIFDTFFSLSGKFTMQDIWKKCNQPQ
jgi:hypothetical protein